MGLSEIFAWSIAILSVVFNFVVAKMNIRNEKLKLFYSDRLNAFKEIIKQVTNIEYSIESILNYKNILQDGFSFKEIYENKENKIPEEMHKPFKESVMRYTIIGNQIFHLCIENNLIFFNENVAHILKRMDEEYFFKFPEPLHPEIIDTFLESKVSLVKEVKKELIDECRRVLGVKKIF